MSLKRIAVIFLMIFTAGNLFSQISGQNNLTDAKGNEALKLKENVNNLKSRVFIRVIDTEKFNKHIEREILVVLKEG